jgi:hypothetical protein
MNSKGQKSVNPTSHGEAQRLLHTAGLPSSGPMASVLAPDLLGLPQISVQRNYQALATKAGTQVIQE